MDKPTAVSGYLSRPPWELYGLVGVGCAMTAAVSVGNVPEVTPWLAGILIVGVAQALLLPRSFAWFGGLLSVVAWIFLRRSVGILIGEPLQSVVEVGLFVGGLVLAVAYRRHWDRVQTELGELRVLRQVLIAGETGSGLLPFEVAELRIREEVDRSRTFRRPLGLLLIEASTDLVEDGRAVDAALARQIAASSSVHDVPFRVALGRFGILLPECDWDDLYQHAEEVARPVGQIALPDIEHRGNVGKLRLEVHFGLGVYDGEQQGDIDLLRAARDSLRISRDLRESGLGALSTFAMPAGPVFEYVNEGETRQGPTEDGS